MGHLRLSLMVVSLLAAIPTRAQVPVWSQQSDADGALPLYVVLATDVSGSMNKSDPLIRDVEGREQALRDDAQVTFLQVLPFRHPNSYIGVAQFTDHISYSRWGRSPRDMQPGAVPERLDSGELPLMPWSKTELDREVLREFVRTVESRGKRPTRVNVAMDWAYHRIERARKRYGQGRAILVILSDGDPDNAVNELGNPDGAVQRAAAQLAEKDINVFPIIVNRASHRPAHPPIAVLTGKEKAAEQLMDLIATKTGGKAYRITPTFDLLDIFLDILGDAPSPVVAGFDVSMYHRTAILIGPQIRSIEIRPAARRSTAVSYSLAMRDGLDPASGIMRKIIPLTRWDIVILRRPKEESRLKTWWSGTWTPVPARAESGYRGRVYLVPDFLLNISARPESSWWTNEHVQIEATLAARPMEVGEPDRATPSLEGSDLSIDVTISPAEGGQAIPIRGGKWVNGKRYLLNSFRLPQEITPGWYQLTFDCKDHVDDSAILLGRFTRKFHVREFPASLQLAQLPTNTIVMEVPARVPPPDVRCKGGEQVYARIASPSEISPERFSGHLHLDNVDPQNWPFSFKQGQTVTDPIILPFDSGRLEGHAVIRIRDLGSDRTVTLPPFSFLYDQAPTQLARRFDEPREALWVGEFHQQTVTVSVFPVAEAISQSVIAAFPDALPGATMEAIDTQGERALPLPVRCTRISDEMPRYVVRDGIPTVVATYQIESDVPIPPANRCVISLGTIVLGLRAKAATYSVVNPVAEGLFTWRMFQDPAEKPASGLVETLCRNDPIRFEAEWKPDLNVTGVEFEIQPPGPVAELRRIPFVTVDLRPRVGAARADVERTIEELRDREIFPLRVRVHFLPSGGDERPQERQLVLDGGQFRARNRLLIPKTVRVGGPAGVDIMTTVFQPIRLPLQASFTGFSVNDPLAARRMEAFKESCTLEVSLETPNDEDLSTDISRSIRWTTPGPPARGEDVRGLYRLEGYARYTPERTGQGYVTFGSELEKPDGTRDILSTSVRLIVEHAPLTVEVFEKSRNEEHLVFNSRAWAEEGKGLFPVLTSLETNLRIHVRRAIGAGMSDVEPFRAGVRVVRQRRANQGLTTAEVFLQREPEDDGHEIDFDVPLSGQGEYSVHVHMRNAHTDPSDVRFTTPTLVSIDPIDVQPLLPPSGRLTRLVRQWPFRYRIPFQSQWSFSKESLAFTFGISDGEFYEGSTDETRQYDDGGNWLTVASPSFLPPSDHLNNQTVVNCEFSLSHRQNPRIRWEHRDVRVVDPWLNVVFQNAYDEEADDLRSLKAPTRVEVKPTFRPAPELETWWTKHDVTIFIRRNPNGESTTGSAPTHVLDKLIQDRKAITVDGSKPYDLSVPGESDLRVFPVNEANPEWTTVVVAEAPMRFWGWPRLGKKENFECVVSATYDAPYTPADGATTAESRLITEWSDRYAMTVTIPLWRAMPWMWWLPAFFLVTVGITSALKRKLVPDPAKLGWQLQVESGRAHLTPNSGNPMHGVIRQTSWEEERNYRKTHWFSRGGKLLAEVVAAWKVVMPARIARIRVVPIAGNDEDVESGVVCVGTSLLRRQGFLWDSQTGRHSLPENFDKHPVRMELRSHVEGIERKPKEIVLSVTRAAN